MNVLASAGWMAIGLVIWRLGVVFVSYSCRNILGALALFVLPMDLSSGSAWLWGTWLVMLFVMAGVGMWGARFLRRRLPRIPARPSSALFLISVVLLSYLRPEWLPVSVEPHDNTPGRSVAWIISACAHAFGAWLGT